MTTEELQNLMQDLVRATPGKYGDMYWVAYLARFGYASIYSGPKSRTHSMTREQAMAECEKFVRETDGGG
jgi:hypothetical protein